MGRIGLAWLSVGMAATVGTAGCTKVKIDPKDASPPTAVIKVKGKDGYAVKTAVSMPGGVGELPISCIATDPQGAKSAALTYKLKSDGCYFNTSVIDNPTLLNFPQPSAVTESAASGTAPTNVSVQKTIKGPVACKGLNAESQGELLNATVEVTCTATNWSATPGSSTASTVLKIALQ